ncbi:glycerophosphodiester phosphodiesterase [Paenibacillus sp. Z3-2]
MLYPKLIAHTGCEGTSWNTLESCEVGMKAGAHIIEVDVRVTQDHVAVLQHDDEPPLNQMNYVQLTKTGQQPETLKRVLTRFNQLPITFNLDLKTEQATAAAIAVVKETDSWTQVWFTGATRLMEGSEYSRYVMWNLPENLHELDETSYRGQVTELCQRASDSGFRGVNLHYECCRPYLIEQAHYHGLHVWIYTLPEDRNLFIKYMHMGVDAVSVYEVKSFTALRALLHPSPGWDWPGHLFEPNGADGNLHH